MNKQVDNSIANIVLHHSGGIGAMISIGYYTLSVLLYCFAAWLSPLAAISSRIIRASTWLGTISYGIYIIHFPLLYLFSKITVHSFPLYIVKVSVFFAVVITLSVLLEKKYQLWIKQKLG